MVFISCNEGALDTSDLARRKVGGNFLEARAHGSTLVTLSPEALAAQALDDAFIHDFPGFVRTGVARGTSGVIMGVMKVATTCLTPLLAVPIVGSEERHLFAATSARFPARKQGGGVVMVKSMEGVGLRRSLIGRLGVVCILLTGMEEC